MIDNLASKLKKRADDARLNMVSKQYESIITALCSAADEGNKFVLLDIAEMYTSNVDKLDAEGFKIVQVGARTKISFF